MLKTACLHLLILLGATLTALHAADTATKPKAVTPPEFAAIIDDLKLPQVLRMSDSVSIARGRSLRLKRLARRLPREWRRITRLAVAHG